MLPYHYHSLIMKFLYISIFLFAFPLSSFAQETSADLGVAAIGLVVSDIEKSEKFYTDIVGMIPSGSFELSAKWSEEAGAANDRPFSVKMFKMVNRKTATILKLAYFDNTMPRPKQLGVDTNAGVNYLTFHYTDFTEVVKRLEKAKIEKLGWVKRDQYQLIFIRDPDGVFIELVGPSEK